MIAYTLLLHVVIAPNARLKVSYQYTYHNGLLLSIDSTQSGKLPLYMYCDLAESEFAETGGSNSSHTNMFICFKLFCDPVQSQFTLHKK